MKMLNFNDRNHVRIEPIRDFQSLFIHFSGGIKAIDVGESYFAIEPIRENQGPILKGDIAKKNLWACVNNLGLKVIAFENYGWNNGSRHSSWSPVVPGNKNHMISPADKWRTAGSRLHSISSVEAVDEIDIDKPTDSVVAHSIGLSLRGMDVSMKAICDFYNERLKESLHEEDFEGRRIGRITDVELFSHVHSFFSSFWISSRLSRKIDCLSRRREHENNRFFLKIDQNHRR